ncbi:MAG: hypothetical protein ACRC41_18330 [Sarcina sp.]
MLMVFISKDEKRIQNLAQNLKVGRLVLNRLSFKIFDKNTLCKQGTRFNFICYDLETQKFLTYIEVPNKDYFCMYKQLETSMKVVHLLSLLIFTLLFIIATIVLFTSIINIYIYFGILFLIVLTKSVFQRKFWNFIGNKIFLERGTKI